ncbi:MAG: hypothetical protein KGJ66_05990 [Alphaproteobacteria bacterium]|nr:hypothetical protein [Alphaproteobacteria bacterium]
MRSLRVLAAAYQAYQAYRDRGRFASDEARLRAAAMWLIAAQCAAGGGGYAHSFHLVHGWRPPYAETTGYIVPTLHHLGQMLGDKELLSSVTTAARWLIEVQEPDGSFRDLAGRAQVFDTGQVLIGLNYLAEHTPELGGDAALRRAAAWLVSVQEADGSFIAHAYNRRPHAYYARVGAALLVAARITGDVALRDAGLKNLRWTLTQQQPNGFFRHLSFADEPPFLHTMVYVLEGLLDGHAETGDATFLASALGFATRLREVSDTRDRVLRSQYREDFGVANHQKCVTGLAQWAGVAFRLARLQDDAGWQREGTKTLEFVAREQLSCTAKPLHGGLFGSVPPHGRYMRFAIPNWGVKFFIDALLQRPRAVS